MIPILVALVYYGGRELAQPGYVQAVYENELGGRYLEAIEGHGESPSYYLRVLLNKRFVFWAPISVLGLALALRKDGAIITRFLRFSAVLVVIFLTIISTAQTKCAWYDLPIYPLLALATGSFVTHLLRPLLSDRWLDRAWGRYAMVLLFLAALFYFPLRATITRVTSPENDLGFYFPGYILRDAADGKIDLAGVVLPLEKYSPQNTFYLKIMESRGIPTDQRPWSELKEGDVILASKRWRREFLDPGFTYEDAGKRGRASLFLITGKH
jgi:hypothetical protein